MENKIKHLELIQGVINRLAINSFQLKGWTVVLVAAILVLLARENRLDAACIALAPIVVFWGLDGYFLWQERLYRALYDDVRVRDCAKVDFCMDVRRFRVGYKRSWVGATLSRTLLSFYIVLTIIISCATVVLNQPNQGDANGATSVLQLPL